MQFFDWIKAAQQQLANVSSSPRLDAELLICKGLNISREELYSRSQAWIPHSQLVELNELLLRRQQGEPMAYILGYQEFWSMPFKVTPATLIPRPETELLVEIALTKLPASESLWIAELGTGCGAVALALAGERPQWSIVATDQSEAALAIARDNAFQFSLDNVIFAHGEWCQPLPHHRYAAIISNPPYIRSGDQHLNQGDVRFEPRVALVAGETGLEAIVQIVRQAPTYLANQGWIMLEHGYDQDKAVYELLNQSGYETIAQYADLAGHMRVIIAQWLGAC